MCIAILNTKQTLSKKTLKNCWTANPDGAGFIFTTFKKLVIFKEMNNFDTFYNEYQKQRNLHPKSNFVIHFRIATSGNIDLTNCHPFTVNENLAFIHNGMIDIVPMYDIVSDTWTFNEMILKGLQTDFLSNEYLTDMIANFIGYSKLVFLDTKNVATIINEDLGQWDGDNWFSNSSYIDRPSYSFNYLDAPKKSKKVQSGAINWDEDIEMSEYNKYWDNKDSYIKECCNCGIKTNEYSKLYECTMCEECQTIYV